MTKNTNQKSAQKLYRNWTENQIRGLGQFLVKTWSAFSNAYGQSSGRMRVEILRQHCGKVSVVSGLFQARSSENQGGQMVSKSGADLEDFQANPGVQKVDKNRTKKVHQEFTKSSPDFAGLSQESCRQSDGKMSAVFILFPHIAEYMRKSPIQFDIPSSYLYVVVLKKPDL